MKKYTVEIQYNPETGEHYIEFPESVTEQVGWGEGDTVVWKDNGDGSWSLTKKELETELVLVDAIHTFRMRYLVEVPKGKSEYALDTVTCQEAKEFSQEFLGETICSHRVVTKEEALALCDADNAYVKTWNEEQKLKSFLTPWADKEQTHSDYWYDSERNQ